MPKRRLWDRLCVDAVAIVQHSRWLAPPGIRRIEKRSQSFIRRSSRHKNMYLVTNESPRSPSRCGPHLAHTIGED